MPVNPKEKPITVLRDETIDQLIVSYSHGELSFEGFERRLDQALDAKTHEELLALTEDLNIVVDETFREKKRRELGFQIDPGDAQDVDYVTRREVVSAVARQLGVARAHGSSAIRLSGGLSARADRQQETS